MFRSYKTQTYRHVHLHCPCLGDRSSSTRGCLARGGGLPVGDAPRRVKPTTGLLWESEMLSPLSAACHCLVKHSSPGQCSREHRAQSTKVSPRLLCVGDFFCTRRMLQFCFGLVWLGCYEIGQRCVIHTTMLAFVSHKALFLLGFL